MAFQIMGKVTICLEPCSEKQQKHPQISASLFFVGKSVDSPHKGTVVPKSFPCHDVIRVNQENQHHFVQIIRNCRSKRMIRWNLDKTLNSPECHRFVFAFYSLTAAHFDLIALRWHTGGILDFCV